MPKPENYPGPSNTRAANRIRIQVIYVDSGGQRITDVQVVEGATVSEVLAASGLPVGAAELAAGGYALSCFGRLVQVGALVREGDRIEIIRPLRMDPKEARRQLAARRPVLKPVPKR